MRDLLDLMFTWETEGLTHAQEIELFHGLIESGLILSLQGTYQRRARELWLAGQLNRLPENEIVYCAECGGCLCHACECDPEDK